MSEVCSVWVLRQKGEESILWFIREFHLKPKRQISFISGGCQDLQLAEVRKILEVFDFSVAGHQTAAGDVGESGGDVGKGGCAVHQCTMRFRKKRAKNVQL